MKFNDILGHFNLRVVSLYPRSFQRCNFINKKDLIGVEVGVFEGDNAMSFLKYSDIKMLYLVDPYKGYDEYSQGDLIQARKKAEIKFNSFKNVKWIFKSSEEAVDDIPDDLDFVYIDAEHTYESLKRDVELYYSKIKKGGFLGGDNFQSVFVDSGIDYNVANAVIDFCREKGIRFFVNYSDWWIIKK